MVAVAVCVLFLVLYQPLLRWLGLERYVERPRPTRITTADSTASDTSATHAPGQVATPSPPSDDRAQSVLTPALRPVPTVLERTVTLETSLYKALFTNRGARLLSVELKYYEAAYGVSNRGRSSKRARNEPVPPGDRVVLAGGPLIALDLGSATALKSLEDAVYTVSESLDAAGETRAITFSTTDTAGLSIRQTYRPRPGDYGMDLEVELRRVPAEWRVAEYSVTTQSWPLLTELDRQGDGRTLRATSLVGANIHREATGGLLKGARSFDGSAVWAAVQNRYFISAIALTQGTARGVVSSAKRRPIDVGTLEGQGAGSKREEDVAINTLVVGLPPETSPVHRFIVFTGPCEYFRLSAMKVGLERAVDLGWSWILPFSKALLWLLKWLYSLLGNYGVAIVVLATLVRVVFHPLNMVSMKSMRAMQKLQPEMERLRQKYKNDSQAMNAALMALYKENKINPAGGCLPLLLQMPLFVALYQVLFNAIELRRAPFFGWIHDLSAPDFLFMVGPFPLRLLPILMLATGLVQQKLTPTDPRQMTSMYLMNVVMLVFFYNLPSGLVLYWTVMNMLTALQQWIIMRQDKPAAVSVPAPVAGRGAGKHRAEAR
jgi:YidC/Oxa1 family membrane protein insertase